MKLIVTRKSHTRLQDGKEVTYQKGESFDGTARELEAFKDRLVAADDEKPTAPKADRPALLARAKELGLNLPGNIKTDALVSAVEEAEKAAAVASAHAERIKGMEEKTDDELLTLAEGLKLDDIPTDRAELIAAIIEAQDVAQ